MARARRLSSRTNIEMRVDGLGALQAKLMRLSAEVERKVARKATSEMALIVREEAKTRAYKAPQAYLAGPKGAPKVLVQPGHVARNIVRYFVPPGERIAGMTSQHLVKVSNKQDGPWGAKNIAVFLEYGINMPQPYPFLRPAFDAKRAEAVAAAKTIITQEIDKLWGQS